MSAPQNRRQTGRPTAKPSQRRPDAATFRRRRLVVGLLALVILGGLVAGGTALWGAIRSDADPGAGPSDSPTPTGPSEEELANPVACGADAVTLSIDLPGDSLPHGQAVEFPVTVRNTGEVPCLVDLGYAGLDLTLFSGGDRVWSTSDCHGERPEHDEYLFDLGYSRTVTISWQGRRSTADCAADQNYAGAGTYRAQVTLAPAADDADEQAGPATETRVFGLE